jgi:two-component system CheB/CheR fusion protein
MQHDNALKLQPEPDPGRRPTQAMLGEISQRLLVEIYAPAAALINQRHEILYFLGPVAQFLDQPAGQPPLDLLALAPPDLRVRLRMAVQGVFRAGRPDSIPGGIIPRGNALLPYHIDLLPVPGEPPLQLICFVPEPPPSRTVAALQPSQVVRTANEEAAPAKPEYHAAVAEVLGWKSGLESLGREMTELNGRLRESLDAQRDASNILGTVLDNIGNAITQLDHELKAKFFTPALESSTEPVRPEIRDLADKAAPRLRGNAAERISNLTPRERQIMKMVVEGRSSKIIATELNISQRTVENHRAAIMRKTEAKSLPALARIAFASGLSNIAEPPTEV